MFAYLSWSLSWSIRLSECLTHLLHLLLVYAHTSAHTCARLIDHSRLRQERNRRIVHERWRTCLLMQVCTNLIYQPGVYWFDTTTVHACILPRYPFNNYFVHQANVHVACRHTRQKHRQAVLQVRHDTSASQRPHCTGASMDIRTDILGIVRTPYIRTYRVSR